MILALASAFILGVVVAGALAPALRRARRSLAGGVDRVDVNRVTTISQVLHLVVQGSPTGVAVVGRDGSILLSNPRAHETGIIHGSEIHPEMWDYAELAWEDHDEHVLNVKMDGRRAGSRVVAVRAVVKPLTPVDDRFAVIYSTDESENTRMEAARRDFVANVSHELKTPVGGMALLAEALTGAAEDPEQVDYFGQRLHREALRLSDLITELISLSKLQGAEALPDMQPVRADDLVEEAIARNQLAAESQGVSLVSGDESGAWVKGDKSLLVTAISNLISNALHYSKDALPVSITQEVVPNPERAEGRGAAEPAREGILDTTIDSDEIVRIRVTDRGMGIAPENKRRVFERFFRVDKARSRSTGGTGLGLAIVKHVVANHGGNITVWSKLGTGSTFTIELPIYHPEGSGEERQLEPATGAPARRSGIRRKDTTE